MKRRAVLTATIGGPRSGGAQGTDLLPTRGCPGKPLPATKLTAPRKRLTELYPTTPAEPVNVAEYGFEDWTADGWYFEYTQAADPVGLGYTPRVPAEQFGPELYLAEEKFSVKIPEDELPNLKTVGDAVNYVSANSK